MEEQTKPPSLITNGISIFGILVAACSLFAVLALIVFSYRSETGSPYLGILTYIIAPAFLVSGLFLVVVGVLRERSRRRKLAPGEIPRHLRIDFNVAHDRNIFLTVMVVAFAFLVLTAFGTYQTYHFTESVQFCGQTCHGVMKPEFTAYHDSPHARVTCAECHIGSGAGWFVRSKLSGAYQVYATMANKYPRPIPTPVKSLRPAQDTCEQCHWPQKFFGAAERVNRHYLSDEQNTPWTVALLMKIGGGDPRHGPVGGIHWHMNINNKTEYIATDEQRLVIPWVRSTSSDGKVTVFQSADNPLPPDKVNSASIRVMDCIDCHNRPAHIYYPPARAVNISMSTGRINASIPSIKKNAVDILTAEYKTTEEALSKIESTLKDQYKDHDDKGPIQQAITEVKKIYSLNFFPEMKVNWLTYPNHIGHTIFPGCFRCHDGQHVSSDGKVISRDCNACHVIVAQGDKEQLQTISLEGLEFQHPVDIGDVWKEMSCSECHTGSLTE